MDMLHAFATVDARLPAMFFPEEHPQVNTHGIKASVPSTEQQTIDPRLLQTDQGIALSMSTGSKRKIGADSHASDDSTRPKTSKRAKTASSSSSSLPAALHSKDVDRSSALTDTTATNVSPPPSSFGSISVSEIQQQQVLPSTAMSGTTAHSAPPAPSAPSAAMAGASSNVQLHTARVPMSRSRQAVRPSPNATPVSMVQRNVQSSVSSAMGGNTRYPSQAPIASMSMDVTPSHLHAGNMAMQAGVYPSYQLSNTSNGSMSAATSQPPSAAPAMAVTAATATATAQPPAIPTAPMTAATAITQPPAIPAAPTAAPANVQPPVPMNAPRRGKGTQTRIAEGKSNYGDTIKDHALVTAMPPQHVDITLVELMRFMPNTPQIPTVIERFARNGVKYRDLAKVQLHATNSLTYANIGRVEGRLKWQSKEAKDLLYPGSAGQRMPTIAKSVGRQTDYTADHWHLRCDYKPQAVKEPFEHVPLSDIYNAIDAQHWPQGNDRGALTKCLEHARANPAANYTTRDWATIIAQQGYTTPPVAAHVNRDERDMIAFLGRCPEPT